MPQLDKLIFLDQLVIFFLFFFCFYFFISYFVIPFYFYIFYSRIFYFSVLNKSSWKFSRLVVMSTILSFESLNRFLNIFFVFIKRSISFFLNKFFFFKAYNYIMLFLVSVHFWFFNLLFKDESLSLSHLNNVSLSKFKYLLF